MNTERGGPGGRLRTKRVSTLNAANFWYHREMAEGAMGSGERTFRTKFTGLLERKVKRPLGNADDTKVGQPWNRRGVYETRMTKSRRIHSTQLEKSKQIMENTYPDIRSRCLLKSRTFHRWTLKFLHPLNFIVGKSHQLTPMPAVTNQTLFKSL